MENKTYNASRMMSVLLAMVMIVCMFPVAAFAEGTTLAKPKSVTLSGDYSGIKVTWQKVDDADEYQVYYSTVKDGSYKKGPVVSGTSATVSSLKLGKTYYFKVRAIDGSKKSDFSYIKSIKIKPTTPVMSKTATSTASTIKISWKKVSEADGYIVYKKTEDGNWTKVTTIKSNTKVSYTDSSVSGKYFYSVVSFKTIDGKALLSAKSSPIKVRTLSAPKSLTVTNSGDEFVANVSWTKSAAATSYQVYYRIGTDGDWVSIGSTKNNTISNTQTHGVTYQYRVRAKYTYEGVTTYGPWAVYSSGYIIGYKPSFVTGTDPSSYSNVSGVGFTIQNTGNATMVIYANSACMTDDTNSSYNRDLILINTSGNKVSYITIKPGETEDIYFAVSGTKTRYNAKTRIFYYFTYDNVVYIGMASNEYGGLYLLPSELSK